MYLLTFLIYFSIAVLLSPMSRGILIGFLFIVGLQVAKHIFLNHRISMKDISMILGSIIGTSVGILILRQNPLKDISDKS